MEGMSKLSAVKHIHQSLSLHPEKLGNFWLQLHAPHHQNTGPSPNTNQKALTLLGTNIDPENWWLEDDISFWDGVFSGANC